jgi:RHS repeat-associated protein
VRKTHAEWNSATGWTNYYHFNGQRVAMRNSAGVFWLHGDHLGSASLTTNSSGGAHSQVRYGPFGNERWTGGNSTPTTYKFTDQRAEDSVGLYDYVARLYSPALARFISPDPIVPRPGDIQAFNRYAYVSHNPMRYVDPEGHAWKEFLNKLGKTAFGAFTGATVSMVSEATLIAIESKAQGVDLTVSDMAKHENAVRLLSAGVGGGTTGAILGATEGKGGFLTVGFASAFGGQVEALARGLFNETLNDSSGNINPSQAVEYASEQGFLDGGTASRDFVAGGISSKLVDGAYSVINRKAGQTVKEYKQIESFNPVTKKPEVKVYSRSGPKKLSPLQRSAVIATQRLVDYFAETAVREIGGQE